MDLEDLIQSGVLRWYEFIPKWKPERGAVTTFTHHVVRSWYLEQLRSAKRANRPQDFLCVDEVRSELLGVRCKLQADAGRQQRIERFFELASPDVIAFFKRFYFEASEDFQRFGLPNAPLSVKSEILWLVARLHISADDFRAVRAACLA